MNRITTPAIDFAAKTITCTKKFLKKAREVNSDEYRLMLQITSDLPAFMIVIKEAVTPVRRNIQPTYTAMAEYIRCMDDNCEEALEAFWQVCRMAKLTKGNYNTVRRWFLDKYPAFTEPSYGFSKYDLVA